MLLREQIYAARGLDQKELVLSAFRHRGLPFNNLTWVAEDLIATGIVGQGRWNGDHLVPLLFQAGAVWKEHGRIELAVFEILGALGSRMNPSDREWNPTDAELLVVPEAFEALKERVISKRFDFRATLEFLSTAKQPSNAHQWELQGVASRLIALGLLDPVECFRIASIPDYSDDTRLRSREIQARDFDQGLCDPATLAFWSNVDADIAWRCLEPHLDSRVEEDEFLDLARRSFRHLKDMTLGLSLTGPKGSALLSRVFEKVDGRLGPVPRDGSECLRRTWLEMWDELSGTPTEEREREPEFRERLRAAADKELGTLRTLFRESPGELRTQKMLGRAPSLGAAANVLFRLPNESIWEGVKPLIVAFRQLPECGLRKEVRSWGWQYDTEPTPEPWNTIPELLINLLHVFFREEQERLVDGGERDSDLLKLRGLFAHFLLDRLKPSKPESGGAPVEPEPLWRVGFLLAFSELQVNPEGKGHRSLHECSASDPNREVRGLARELHDKLRHGVKRHGSARVAVFRAIWILFQTHLRQHNVSYTEFDALVSLKEMVRRTTVSGDES